MGEGLFEPSDRNHGEAFGPLQKELDGTCADGRVISVRVVGSNSTVTVSGSVFRSMFALPSAFFAPVF